MQDHLDAVAVAGQRLVDRVVDRLVHQVVEAVGAGVADVHGGALADRLQPLEDLDVARGVGVAHQAAPRTRSSVGSVTRPSRTSHQAARPVSGSATSAVVRKTWPALGHVLQHAGLHLGIQLGERVVEQQHRRAADRARHRPRLGEAQRERHQPLLSARAVETQIALVHLDQEIVAMRPDHRLASPRLLDEVLVERGQDVGLGRVRREARRCIAGVTSPDPASVG